MSLRPTIHKVIARIASFLLPPVVMRSKKFFRLWESRGYHVTPVHFSEPIPDTSTLRESLWSRPSALVGIDMNEQGQLDLLSRFSSEFGVEYRSFPRARTPVLWQYWLDNSTFGAVDGEILYCMIRHFKPRRFFEIGSGSSTYLSAQAILKNREVDGCECELTTFDPYPNDVLRSGFPGLSRLIRARIQDIPLSRFNELEKNDILFIDSSHVLQVGGDVQYEYLEILPRLKSGVIVHAHDVFFPSEYPREWVLERYMFWTEQYLLQAFLSFNHAFQVLWGGSYMHTRHPDKLAKAFSSYDEATVWPGSLWMQRTK